MLVGDEKRLVGAQGAREDGPDETGIVAHGDAHGPGQVEREGGRPGGGGVRIGADNQGLVARHPERLGRNAALQGLARRLVRATRELLERGRGEGLVGADGHGRLAALVHDRHEHAVRVPRRPVLERPLYVLLCQGDELRGDPDAAHAAARQRAQVAVLKRKGPVGDAPAADDGGAPQREAARLRPQVLLVSHASSPRRPAAVRTAP